MTIEIIKSLIIHYEFGQVFNVYQIKLSQQEKLRNCLRSNFSGIIITEFN